MNRQALKILLRSGRFLCFDTRPAYHALGQAENVETETAEAGAATAEPSSAPGLRKAVPEGALFDNRMLNLGIYFKEASTDDTELDVTTRVFFPYNDANLLEGGESTLAARESLVPVLEQKGALPAGTEISGHDLTTLETLTALPTFDPFLLLSKRREMEAERPIDPSYFQIDKVDWDLVRQPVMQRISVLVAKAHGADSSDVYELYRDGVDDVAKTMAEDQRKMANSVVDSIWRGEATEHAKMLISSFRLDDADTEKILFAWKGVNYYEFQFKQYEKKCRPLFEWLASSDSLPRDSVQLDSRTADRIKARREEARRILRETYRNIATILKTYNTAFDTLVRDDQPGDFRDFLSEAPEHFVSLGMSLGILAHTTNAWMEMTKEGKSPLIRAPDLETFYDFITAIGASELES